MGLRSLSAAWRKLVRIGDALILSLKTQKKIAFALQIWRHDLAETFRHRVGRRQYRNNKREDQSDADNVSHWNIANFSNPGLADEPGLDDLR
jgi:hypothetical protein